MHRFILIAAIFSSLMPIDALAQSQPSRSISPEVRAKLDSGEDNPSHRRIRYIMLMNEYSDIFNENQVPCLKTRTILKPQPPKDNLLGDVKIGINNLWPKTGETLEFQVNISFPKERYRDGSILRPVEEVEIMYELTASDGVIIRDAPELPRRLFRNGETICINIPVEVLNNDVQLVKLNVCAYQNGILRDWAWDNEVLNPNFPESEKEKFHPWRRIDMTRKKATMGRKVAIFDENGKLVEQ